MKRILALLLTLAMLLTMVGTVAVAADAASAPAMPEAAVTISSAGVVTVKLSEGATDFEGGSVEVKTKDGTYFDVNVTYDKTKGAFVGTDAKAASGQVSSVSLSKYDTKDVSTSERQITNNNASFSYYTSEDSEDLKGKLSHANLYKRVTTQKKNSEGVWKKSKYNFIHQETDASYSTGIITYDTYTSSETTYGAKGNQSGYTSNSETRRYDDQTGAYKGKNTEETKRTYDVDGNRLTEETSTKSYNEDDVVTGSGNGTTTTTYNTARDVKTDKYNYEEKSFSSKEYLKSKTKTESTTESKLIDGYFEPQTSKSETKTTNRDGILKQHNTTAYTYKEGNLNGETISEKTYNTYTKALTGETTVTGKKGDDDVWKFTVTKTKNNDDGSLRSKTVNTVENEYTDEYEEGYWGVEVITETHYNNANKVVATKDKEGTWKDGSGKVIGKNESKDGNYESTDVYFKQRTGEISHYDTYGTTVASDGTETHTEVHYSNGKKIFEEKTVTKPDGSYETTENGVLRESYSEKDGIQETKKYDIKGTLSSTTKRDTTKNTETTYDYRGKVQEVDDFAAGTDTYYDTDTGKVVSMTKSVEGGWEHYDADLKLRWSEKTDPKTGDDVFYDAKGKEFARTFSKYEKNSSTRQYIADANFDEGAATLEKVVGKTEVDGKTTTTTNDYTKWDSVGGTKKNEVTRKEVTVSKKEKDKSESKTTKDGTLVKSSETVYNDYDDSIKTTTKNYDWFTGKQTSASKSIKSGVENDPMSYYKRYDKYDNLQYYRETDNTDRWNWQHEYYAGGTLKEESWYDSLDGESTYNATYYLDGSLRGETTWNLNNGVSASYHKDGTYAGWSESKDGVTNEWLYDRWGNVDGYKWNQKWNDGVSSYDYYDAAGTLVYSETSYGDEDGWDSVLADGTYAVRTDPAGNKWTKRYNGVTLTLANKGSGWQYAVGEWFYIVNGEPVQGEWKQIDGSWYYFNWDGTMDTGLRPVYSTTDGKETSKTYALDGVTGEMTTGGWAMLDDHGYNWAFTDANGEVVTGWQLIGGQYYYFDDGWDDGHDAEYKAEAKWTQNGERGTMATGAVQIWNSDGTSKHTYFFNEDGTWDNSPGWKVAESVDVGDDYGVEYHYYDNAGREVTGWRVIDGDWYYFNEDGVMKNGWVKSGPNWYFMDPAQGGAMATDGWTEDVYEGWYYMDKNGNYKTGWLQDGNTWYYLKDDGSMAAKEWAKSGSDWYYMDENGAMATGWIQDHGSWYCLKSDGTMKTGWEGAGNTWYYLDKDGAMVTDADVTIDGKTYHFDETGLCTNP